MVEMNWKEMLGKKKSERPEFILLPCGMWKFDVVNAEYREDQNDSKQNPGEKWISRSVLFELIPNEQLNGEDPEKAANMTDENKVDQRQWHRIDLRKGSDMEKLERFLEALDCYDDDLPLAAENGEADCLGLVSTKLPQVIAEVLPHVNKRGEDSRKLGESLNVA